MRSRSFFAIFLSFFLTATAASAADLVKPFVHAYTVTGSSPAAMAETQRNVIDNLESAGFEVVDSYSPYDGARVLAITSDGLKRAAASSEFGGYVAAMRVTLTEVDGSIEVSWTNPVYYGNSYRVEDTAALTSAKRKLVEVLGSTQEYGTGDEELTAEDMRGYHYMFGMEYFDDPSELAEYTSYGAAIAAVESGLEAERGGVSKVYRIDIPGKKQTVFGVGLSEGCSGDEYIMSRIDKDRPRSTGHLPYEILVHEDGTVYALYARFRIAISWPHLPMIANPTGATFFNIMCAPNAIEEALIEAAGGEL